ncbi:nodal modulator 1 [Tanacetum coccineum]
MAADRLIMMKQQTYRNYILPIFLAGLNLKFLLVALLVPTGRTIPAGLLMVSSACLVRYFTNGSIFLDVFLLLMASSVALVMGVVTLLSGQPKEGVSVEARCDLKCYYEETVTDSSGSYRLRGLHPDTSYTIREF